MKTLTYDEVEWVSGGSLKSIADAVGDAIADGAETFAGGVVGFFKGLGDELF